MGFEQFLRRLALSGGAGWGRALAVATACVLVGALVRVALTPLLGSLGGMSTFIPGGIIAGLWAGRRGGFTAILLGIGAGWLIAWLHPDPMDLYQMGIGTGLTLVVGLFSAEVAAALRRALSAEAAAVRDLEAGQHNLRLAHEAGKLGAWEWDLGSDRLKLSDNYLRNWRVISEPEWDFLELAARVHPDDYAGVLESRRRVIEDGETYASEYRVVDSEGVVRWFASQGEPVRDASGRIVKVHGVNRDITEQKRTEQVLRESEERFRTMANSAPSPVWVTRAEGGVEFVNEGFVEFFGRPREALLGDAWLGLMHPDDRERIVTLYESERARRLPYEFEARFQNGAGEYRWVSARCRPRTGAGGEFMGYVGIAFDITESRIAQEALRESEARFRAMADSAPAPIWVSGAKGGIQFINQAGMDFFGGPERGLELAWIEHLHPDDRDRVLALRDRSLAKGDGFEFEARFRNRKGRWRWMRASTRPRFDPAGEFMGYIGIAFDVTDAHDGQESLRAQERRQRFLLQLGDGLRESDEPRDIAAFAERSLGAHLHVARAGYGEVDEATGTITIGDSWTDGQLEPISGVFTLESYGPAVVAELLRGRPVRVDDTASDPRTADVGDAFQAQGVRARLSVPVVRGGRTRAVFFLHDTQPRSWTDEDAALVEDAASRTWTEIERARALAEVRESEERFRSIANSAPILVWVTNADRRRAFVNQTYVEFMGDTFEQALVRDWRSFLHPDDHARILSEQVAGESSMKPFSLEARYKRHDGEYRWLRSFSRPRMAPDGTLLGFVGAAYDVTEERQVQADLQHINELLAERVAQALSEKEHAEAALIRAQRLEALGRLTGGVAHDFNNLLTVVVGALDMILKHPEDADKRRRMAEAAMAAARRGEQLTHQLLAFSRRQALRPAVSDVNALIREGEPLIRRAVGDGVEFACLLCRGKAVTRVDPAQFEAALFNLVVNARDATAEGGRIEVRTTTRELAEGEVADIPAGGHVCVTVTDTGSGMDSETLARVFEPFFTTKPQGKGTGLGLSQVYGFAQQSGGGVTIDSAPGRGTTVTLFLPASAESVPAKVEARPREAERGPLNVLLVEDDREVAAIAETLLHHLGHHVVRVSGGARALAKLRSKAAFDLLLTDVVMPGGIDGVELARRALEMRPDLKVVLTSGYAGEAVDRTLLQAPWPFLRKPYSQEELAEVVAAAAPGPAARRRRRVAAKA